MGGKLPWGASCSRSELAWLRKKNAFYLKKKGRSEKDDGETGADEKLFPEGAPQRHINWQKVKEDYELFVGHGHGASAIRVGSYRRTP